MWRKWSVSVGGRQTQRQCAEWALEDGAATSPPHSSTARGKIPAKLTKPQPSSRRKYSAVLSCENVNCWWLSLSEENQPLFSVFSTISYTWCSGRTRWHPVLIIFPTQFSSPHAGPSRICTLSQPFRFLGITQGLAKMSSSSWSPARYDFSLKAVSCSFIYLFVPVFIPLLKMQVFISQGI